MAACALCGKTRLLCKSHIIPKAIIREMRAHDERMFWHDLGKTRRPRRIQDGWKEPLLCDSCEQRIGRWEQVVCEELRGKRRASATRNAILYDGPIIVPPGVVRPAFHILETQNCDYAAWRLFQLSMIWRMDRSKLTELATVNLGEARTDIEKMIMAGDPGAPMDYPCWIYVLSLSGQPMRGFMSTPHRFEYKGYPAIELAFGGLGWLFIIGRDVVCDTMRKFVLDSTGRMRLPIREATTVAWFMKGCKQLEKLGNWTEGDQRRQSR